MSTKPSLRRSPPSTDRNEDCVRTWCPGAYSDDAGPELTRQWQAVHEETYRLADGHGDPAVNFAGWNSSYDGLPIPAQEMQDWVDCTVERISALQPRRVLEIGCGTGLLVFRIAAQCEKYVGTDFAPTALTTVARELSRLDLHHVELQQAAAHDLARFDSGSFDTVILNSVVQYFPSIDYLVDVLTEAMRVLATGGRIFLGDVRSLPLLGSLHTSVEIARSPRSLSTTELRRRILARVNGEEELLIDPSLFPCLRGHVPRIAGYSVQPKRGQYQNELTRFRFDVVLSADHGPPAPAPLEWLDWDEKRLTADELQRKIADRQCGEFGIRGVPDARLSAIAAVVAILAGDPCPDSVGELGDPCPAEPGVDPEALWRCGNHVHIACSLERPACIDVLVSRNAAGPVFSKLENQPITRRSLARYTNQPVRKLVGPVLSKQLGNYLGDRLPAYMLPSAYVFLDRLPLSRNGKVDRTRLPAPELIRPDLRVPSDRPQSAGEAALAAIWAETLGLDWVGRTDDFFSDLGGNSLTAMRVVSRIRERFQVELPLRHLFDFPTLAGAAQWVENARRFGIDTAAQTRTGQGTRP